MNINRRGFIKTSAIAGAGLTLTGGLARASGRTAPSDRIVVGVMGVNNRGNAVGRTFATREGCEVAYLCDVDSRAPVKAAQSIKEALALRDRDGARMPEAVSDFRRMLEDPDVDAVVITASDHWHTPATILALQAGKHVYVEKPASHNAQEAEMIVDAAWHYNRHVQMGNQQRSDPRSIQVINDIHNGLIGRAYYAHTWYANNRSSIGRGQQTAVPDWLDYELWQGPAPRKPYQDNLIHYNWHWFWNWGTGEICNNGAHELDVARWALGVDRPVRASSSGGRYHFNDDWETFDTQVATFDFEDGKSITWHGRSCNGFPLHNRSRGTTIHGERGTVLLDRSGYTLFNENNEVVRWVKPGDVGEPIDAFRLDDATTRHVENFLDTIRGLDELNSPIETGQRSVMLCHLGNIAQRTGRSLTIDPDSGRIQGDDEAMALWRREYEPGWEPSV